MLTNPDYMANIIFKSQQLIICFFLLFSFTTGISQTQTATAKEYEKFFTTYPYSDPNPIPRLTSLYPYFRYDGFTDKPVQKAWKVVELENDYIKVMILPEIGGKIWTAIENLQISLLSIITILLNSVISPCADHIRAEGWNSTMGS